METLKISLHQKKIKNKAFLTKFIILMGMTCLVLFFIPAIQICIQNETNNFCLSFFSILKSNHFSFFANSSISQFSFNAFTKICFTLSLILIPSAIAFSVFKLFNFSAACFFLAGFCPLGLISTANELRKLFLNLQISSNRIFIGLLWPFFLLTLFCLICGALSLYLISLDKLIKTVFLCFSCLSLFFLFFLTAHIIIYSGSAIEQFGFFKILINSQWNPSSNQFGILHLVESSLFSTLGALLFSAPVGILTAIFMAEMCSKKVLKVVSSLIDLMGGIPSVVFGFFGMTIIVPAIKLAFSNFKTQSGNPIVGDSMLAVILVLSIMILPTIISTSFVALRAVPKQFKEASVGLGANKIETIFKICLPAAKKNIVSGLVLAFGRAIGETMAVIMVAGNIVNPPEILGTVRLLTTGIALDLGYASGVLKSVLFFMGLILILLIGSLNLIFNLTCKKNTKS